MVEVLWAARVLPDRRLHRACVSARVAHPAAPLRVAHAALGSVRLGVPHAVAVLRVELWHAKRTKCAVAGWRESGNEILSKSLALSFPTFFPLRGGPEGLLSSLVGGRDEPGYHVFGVYNCTVVQMYSVHVQYCTPSTGTVHSSTTTTHEQLASYCNNNTDQHTNTDTVHRDSTIYYTHSAYTDSPSRVSTAGIPIL